MIKGQINLAVDVVLFTIIDEKANVLLIRRKHEPFLHKQALIGGFVNINETFQEAALRELKEETGIKNVRNIEILDIYDQVDRDPRGRVITIAFIAIANFETIHELKAAGDAIEAEWVPIDEVKELAFDHNKIFSDALKLLATI